VDLPSDDGYVIEAAGAGRAVCDLRLVVHLVLIAGQRLDAAFDAGALASSWW